MNTQTAPTDQYSELDEWFAENGFEVVPSGMLFPGRKWSGIFQGRKTTVMCSVRTKTRHYGEISRRRYAGHELAGEMETTAPTRLSVVGKRAAVIKSIDNILMSWMSMKVIQEDSEDYPGMRIAAYEEPWANVYLAEPDVKMGITSFFEAAVGQNPTYSLQPGAASFRMRGTMEHFTPDRINHILDAMVGLSERVDAQPPPTKKAKIHRFEQMAKDSPVLLAIMVLGGLMFAIFFLTALMIGFGFLMITKPVFLLLIPALAVGGWMYLKRKLKRNG